MREFSYLTQFALIAMLGLAASGCASTGSVKDPRLMPEDVPALFKPVAATETDRCAAIANEIAKLDSGLGGPAAEVQPVPPPTKGQRATAFGKKLALETVKGYVQPFIQTKRAVMNDDEKDRRAAEASDRGAVRRAYLKGLSEGIPCPAAAAVAAST